MSARDADAYLAKLSADKRATLEKVRRAIRAAAPEAEEGMSYGMPAFIQGKPIAGYSASSDHCSYFPMSGAITASLAQELEGYQVSKGGFRFPIGKPPPAALVRKLVKARLAEIEGKPKGQARKPVAKTAAKGAAPKVSAILADLKRNASAQYAADMFKRYGIVTKAEVYAVTVAYLRALAKKIGRDHKLAQELWRTGVHDARMLAPMVGDPAQVTPAEMERWAKDFDNWAIVDTCCFHYWDRSPYAFKQIEKWSKAKDEFVKRAGFALMSSCALHKQGTDEQFLRGLELIEREAADGRNFVKKAVSWALRAIGGRKSPQLRSQARALAKRLAASDDATERWVGKDALRALAKA